MSNASDAINKVLLHEGGYVNNPLDAGKATNWGISKKVYESFVGRSVTDEEIKNMPKGNAYTIYEKWYWNAIGGNDIKSFAVAYSIFDQAVNRGVTSALMQAQKVLNEPQTGKFSSSLVASINSVDEKAFVDAYLEYSRQFYKAIVANKPDQVVFLKGWLNRVTSIENFVYGKFSAVIDDAKAVVKNNPIPITFIALVLTGGIIYMAMKDQKGKAYAN